jgi:tetraacyldisaccharide 4'-kinase
MIIIRILFLPFTLLYAVAILLRDLLYKAGILTRTSFDFPIVCIGNLSVGGTGKTPHIEWLIRALRDEYRIAVLSRGYKRKTTGYVLAGADATAATIGDEPLQIKRKFSDITVAVSESRVLGVPALLADAPGTGLILMDDGFQHMPIRPGYAVVLTDYNNMYTSDWLMPSGTLREFRSGSRRAQCIIVTKCPPALSVEQQQALIRQIDPQPGQIVLFSKLEYGSLQPVYDNGIPAADAQHALVFSGIARHAPFVEEVKSRVQADHVLNFKDHKEYDAAALSAIVSKYTEISAGNKIIITTEKDAVKLHTAEARSVLGNLPVYYLPVQVAFFNGMGEQLVQAIRDHATAIAIAEDEEL